MTPYEHSLLSVRDFKGKVEDYIAIHEWLDQTKAHYAHWKHRAILHNSFGMVLGEQFFGAGFQNSSGIHISTREILRRHIIQDLGHVPTIKDWLEPAKYSVEIVRNLNTPNQKDLDYIKSLNQTNEKKELT